MKDIAPVRFEQGHPMFLAGIRRQHTFAEAAPGIAAQWQEFASLPPLARRIGENTYGVMCGSSPTGLEYMCGVEVASFAEVPEGVGRVRVPEQRYAVFAHKGGTSTLSSTWRQILAWLDQGPYQSAHTPDFEVYAPGADVIEIFVGIVRVG